MHSSSTHLQCGANTHADSGQTGRVNHSSGDHASRQGLAQHRPGVPGGGDTCERLPASRPGGGDKCERLARPETGDVGLPADVSVDSLGSLDGAVYESMHALLSACSPG